MNRDKLKRLQVTLTSALAASVALYMPQTQAQAQGAAAPPGQLASKGADPRLQPMVSAHGLTRQEAARQLELTDSYQQQIGALREQFRDNFLQSIFNYGRSFSITLVFDRDVNLADVQKAVSSDLRPVVRVKRSRLGRQEITATRAKILAQLAPHFEGVGVSFDYESDRFRIYLADDADEQNAITRLDPSIRSFVTLKRGASRSLAGTGSEADDPTHPADKSAIWGGWPIWVNTAPSCTAGFVARDTLSQGMVMLTAGHCPDTNARLRWTDGTFKTLQDAFYQSYGGSYDMQAHWGAYLSSDGYFWVDNDVSGTYSYDCSLNGTNCRTGSYRNLYSGVGSTGYVAVTNAFKGTSWSSWGYNDNHPVNAWRCKYGRRTGVTCGQITDSEISFSSAEDNVQLENFVRVRIDPSWPAAAMRGDSGGPVFTITNSATTFPEATAAGISSHANVKSTGQLTVYRPCVPSLDGDCYLDYMPIDRINDTHPLAVEQAGTPGAIDVN